MIRDQFPKGAVVSLWVQRHLLGPHVQCLHLLVVALVYILFVICAHHIYGYLRKLILLLLTIRVSLLQSVHVITLLFENDFVVNFIDKFNLLPLLFRDLSLRGLELQGFFGCWARLLLCLKSATWLKPSAIQLVCLCVIQYLLRIVVIVLQYKVIVHNWLSLCNFDWLSLLWLIFLESLP